MDTPNYAFSADAAKNYREIGPRYPRSLFDYISTLCPARDTAMDIGTGSGQAAEHLAALFKQVIATDPSREQIENAVQVPNIRYICLPAEMTDAELHEHDLRDSSLDLITVAGSLHYFDLEKFNPLVKRLLKPGGIYAVWCFEYKFEEPKLTEITDRFIASHEEFAPEPCRTWREQYRNIAFPFEEIHGGAGFESILEWDMNGYLTFMGHSGMAEMEREKSGRDPIDKIRDEVKAVWGYPAKKQACRIPIRLRVGRNVK